MLPVKIKSWLALLLLAGVAATSHADPTVFSQPASTPDTYDTWASFSYLGTAVGRTYDNFTLTATTNITALQWEGNYVDTTGPGPNPAAADTTTFEISFWSDNAGQPGSVLATETIALAATAPTSLGTVPFGFDAGTAQIPLVSYSAVLPTPFVATAGQTYWISILSNSTMQQPEWGWYSGTGGDGQCVQDFEGSRVVQSLDRALVLEGTPASQAVAGSVQFTVANTTVVESTGSVTLSVSRAGGNTGAISVNYSTADATAVAGTDYQATSGTLSWADGDATAKTITVPILNRNLTAGSTFFLLNLSAPAGGATLASPTQAAVTILDTAASADLVSVSLLSPPAGVTLTVNQPVVLQADVEALSGTLSNVEFFAVDSAGNSTDLGTASARAQVTWTPTTAGSYTLQVVATDSSGNTQQATSAVTVVAAGAALPQTNLQAGIDGITVPLGATVPVVAQAVDSAGNALANVQFYLDGVPVSSAPVTAMRQAELRAADASAGTLYEASVLASKIQQVMTVVGTTASGVSSVSTAAIIYGKTDAGTPPTAAISNVASGASVAAGQSVSVAATSGSQPIAKVQLVVDNQSIGVATAAPYTFSLPTLAAGAHILSIIATDLGALSSVSTPVVVTAQQAATSTPAFFTGEVALANGVYYLAFANGNYFGYYSFLPNPAYIYHFDLGFEYVFDAADGKSGVYFYDFASGTFFYTSPSFPFPYLYDFSLNSVLYYYPDPNNAGHYNTNGIRYFYDFNTGQIITK